MTVIKSSRLYILLKLFLVLMLIFVLQKPVFMLYNSSVCEGLSFSDYLDVMWHGLALDSTMSGYVLVIPWIVLFVSFFVKVNLRKWLVPYFSVILLLLAIIFVADVVMYGFWQFKLDSTVFLYTDKPADAMASVSGLFVFLTIVSILVLTVAYCALVYYVLPSSVLNESSKPLHSLVMIPVLGLMFIMIRGGVGDGTANVTSAYYSEKQFLNHSAVNSAFNMFYSLSHQQDFASEFQYYDDEKELNSLMQGIYNTESVEPDTLFTTKRPNVILVVWEGCGASIAGCVGAKEDATPNLDKLASEGILFSNCQGNSFRTDRGLVSINSGWLGYPSASLMKIPEKCETLPGIARSLKDVGYNTEFWYGGDINFTNMGGFMLQNGYEKTYSDKDFSRKERSTDWGVPDEHLFGKVSESVRNLAEPFFVSIMTLSSHEPWDVPYRRLKKDIENSFAYTDDCLGKFVSKLKAEGKWDNTVLIVVPDHGVSVQEGRGRSSLDVIHIPLVMAGGAVKEHRVINTLMNQSDLAATLLGQLGIDHKDFIFSRDVLSKTYTYPTAIHCSRVEFSFFDSTGVSTYDLDGNMVVQNVDEIGDNKEQRVRKGKAILQTLYKDTANR